MLVSVPRRHPPQEALGLYVSKPAQSAYEAMNAGMEGNAPFATETDGWFEDGGLGSDQPLELLPGLNVLDFVTEESCFCGGIGRLDLKVIPSNKSPCADDITSQFRISSHPITFDPATQLFVQRVRLTNIGAADPIFDPIFLVLDNQNGVTTCADLLGSPYRRANLGTDKVLSPGEAGIVLLKFRHRWQGPIRYTPRVLAGDNR